MLISCAKFDVSAENKTTTTIITKHKDQEKLNEKKDNEYR